MKRRIREGRAESETNPSVQDLITALQEGPRAAIRIYRSYTEKQYRRIKDFMDAMETLLPLEVRIAWKAIEAIHDMESQE